MALCVPRRAAPVAVVRGTVEGLILGPDEEPRGTNGFGYDPLFYVSDLDKTTAELTQEEKNRISHRGAASRRMWEEICRRREALR
jgi:XTP/dITP diphosphohydrolase